MKTLNAIKTVFVLNTILCYLLVCSTAAPRPESVGQQNSIAIEHTQSEAITAQSVSSELNFVQSFIQLLSQLYNNFNTLFPKFVNLFTTNAPAALAPTNLRPPGQGLPSLPEISAAVPSTPNFGAWQPEKINTVQRDHTNSAIPRDVELIGNDIIETMN